jgi:hypothetical protein
MAFETFAVVTETFRISLRRFTTATASLSASLSCSKIELTGLEN